MEEAVEQRPDPLVGTLLGERYRLTRKIGEGGMGAVYEAMHVVLNKTVAVKLLRDKYLDRREVADRLVQEARHASSIRHPHIVDVTDSGSTVDGRTFLVMELLQGQNLAEIIRQQAPLPEARSVEIVRQVASALSAAHARRVLHRDVKPDNVILIPPPKSDPLDSGKPRSSDFVKVVDFGISKSFRLDEEDADESMRLTNTGVILGTPLYMSPEQARGQDDLDHRADIYSLGVILYECITGEVPFRGVNYLSVLSQVATQEVAAPRALRPELQLSDGVDRVVMKAMAKSRDDRYQTMAQFEADLERLSEGRRVEAERVESRTLLAAPRFRWGWGVGALAAAAAIVISILATGWLLEHSRVDAQRREADETQRRMAQPVPKPAPAPLSPTVAVRVLSEPTGAEVRLGDQLLGHTPDELRVPRGTSPLRLDVALEGYRPTSTSVTPNRDGQVQVNLLPLDSHARARRSATPAVRQSKSDGPSALPTSDETLPNPYY